ncbi:MAG: hypothetical protein AAB961_00600, partial [Patescibacteria group bacterium]
ENIYWISGISSLAGATSALASVYVFTRFLRSTSWFRIILFCFSFLFMASSLLWYEGMMGMPLVIVASAVLFGKKKEWGVSGLFVLLIPLYWWLRSAANAVSPEGNYGINVYALPFNVVGNGIGYIGMSLFGPTTADFFWNLRQWIKANPTGSAILVIVVLAIGIVLWRRARNISVSRQNWFWLSVFIFSLVPYLGLGNIAERYGYIASSAVAVLVIIGLVRVGKIVAVIALLSLLWVNWWQLTAVRSQWSRASVISENILQTSRKLYFPLETQTNLVFVGVPERIGRAWLFPVGLPDAMNHVFGDTRLRVYTVGTRNEGINLGKGLSGVTHVLFVGQDYEVTEIFD